jgi:hypothetical protein
MFIEAAMPRDKRNQNPELSFRVKLEIPDIDGRIKSFVCFDLGLKIGLKRTLQMFCFTWNF